MGRVLLRITIIFSYYDSRNAVKKLGAYDTHTFLIILGRNKAHFEADTPLTWAKAKQVIALFELARCFCDLS